ncbi:MAG: 3-hydroxypropionyl-coenzyme A dehydratase [Candidatus Heimdallarchaeota archaeon LC_3]|nr:MAG: 3-hydroxypropionyl-coenzyme A dehydratase [Candidatus Heimdallarchaeota archaeon LC_3]
MFKNFLVEKSYYIAKVIINRPEKRNAMNKDLFIELKRVFHELNEDPEVRVIILTGTKIGDKEFFSAGIDINELAQFGGDIGLTEIRHYSKQLQEGISAVEMTEKPVIALLNGYCFGSGFELALACDFRVASSKTQVGLLETSIGLIPDLGGITRIVKTLGTSIAKKVILTSDKFNAEESLQLGLVDWVYEPTEVEDKAFELANKLLRNAPLALGVAKRTIDQVYGQTQETGLLIEQLAQLELLKTEDTREAFLAKLEGREPDFKGK